MSKRKPPDKGARPTGRAQAAAADRRKPQGRQKSSSAEPAKSLGPSPAAIRETIESVVIAFVLAFLFRTFEAEAFVIPTGSMATTLMGRHKDLVCRKCGYPYRVSASEELTEDGTFKGDDYLVRKCTCPMCRYTMSLGAADPREEYPSYKGDRILVGKFCYEFADPERWDVAVFHYPGGANTNFIKRLVGLPGETVRIRHGDILIDEDDDGQFTMARKPPNKLLAMLQPVFDNNFAPKIIEQGWPPRWSPWPSRDGSPAGGWQPSPDSRSFETDGTMPGETWIRYEHRAPSTQDWRSQEENVQHVGTVSGRHPKPRLIGDFCAYNSGVSTAERLQPTGNFGAHWVGDLALTCSLEVRSDSGQVVFELVEGGRPMQCRIDVGTGAATLTIAGTDSDGRRAMTADGKDYVLTAQTKVHGPGQYEIIFANVDDQLRLWVDGSAVQFGASDEATCYAPLNNFVPQNGGAGGDLAPVGVASQRASLHIGDLRILRDVYYIAVRSPMAMSNGPITDFEGMYPSDLLADPNRWRAFESMRHVDFTLGADEFFALGDNSAKSKDGRLWPGERRPPGEPPLEYFVKRDLLIGKALYIYWPHSWGQVPGTSIGIPFPPNFARMGFVR